MKTMRQILTAYTDEETAPITKLWAMTGEPDEGSKHRLETLLKRMRDSIAARFVWEYLTYDERQVLYRAMAPSTRYAISHDNLRKKTQLSPERYEAALHNLIRYALLHEFELSSQNMVYIRNIPKSKTSSPAEKMTMLSVFNENLEALYKAGRELFTPSGDRSTMSFSKLLSTVSENELYQIMQNYAVSWGAYYSRSDFGNLFVDKLLDMDDPLDFLPKIDEPSQNLFRWLREHGGKANMQEVCNHTKMNDATLLKTLHTLAASAIAFDTFSKNEHILFIPQELYDHLKSVTATGDSELEKAQLVEREADPSAIRGSEHIAVYDIATLVGAVYQQTIEPTQAGKVPKRLAAKIRPLLRGQARKDYQDEDEYLDMMLDIAQQLNIMQLSNPPLQEIKPAYEPGPFLEQWAQFPLAEQTRQLLLYWIENFNWRDVYGVNYSSWSTYSWDAAEGRKALLRQLEKCVPGRWYTIKSLLQMIWDEGPFAFRPQSPYYHQPKLRKNTDTRAKWDRCEGQVYIGILASTLYELGIVSLGYEQADALTATNPINPDLFCVTELGGTILSMQNPRLSIALSEPQSGRTLVVQPNFELLLLQPDLPTLYSLLPFAQANQIGLVSRLTLTKNSVLRGLRAGKTLEHILSVLQERSPKELPQNVEYTLRDWTKSYKDVRISQVLLFEVSNEEAAQLLPTLPALQGLNIRQLGPRLLAVSGDVNLQSLRKALEKEGINAHISGDIFSRPKYSSSYSTIYGRYR